MRKPSQPRSTEMSKVQRREQIAFATATADALRALGAWQVRPGYDNATSAVVCVGDFALDTRAGRLVVHANGDSIMTRFDDAQLGALHVGATMPSGKWNFHLFEVGIDSLKRGQYDRDRKLLALFLKQLTPILLAPGEAPLVARPTYDDKSPKFDRAVHLALVGRHDDYAHRDFATAEFWTQVYNGCRATAKLGGESQQAILTDIGTWQAMNAVNQPTVRAFAIVHPDGSWERGPRYDEAVVGDVALPNERSKS